MTERPIDIFAKRLDEIFEQGMPTKALVIDAFHKATETPIYPEPPSVPTDEEIGKMAKKRCPYAPIKRSIYRDGLRDMRDLLTTKEEKK